MTLFEDRPSVCEQYAHALRSTHLEVKPTRGDVDMLVAAGGAGLRESLGVLLYRTRVEFDSVRMDVQRAQERIASGDESQAVTDLALILLELKTLRETRQALGSFADQQATLKSFMLEPQAVMAIAGRALEAWLDPTCRRCQGRRFTGGFGLPIAWCSACGATGRRLVRFDHSAAGHDFGRFLLDAMDVKCERVARRIRRSMRPFAAKPEDHADEYIRAMRARLNDLKCAVAQED